MSKQHDEYVTVRVPIRLANAPHAELREVRMKRSSAERQGLFARQREPTARESAQILTNGLNALLRRAQGGDVQAQRQLKYELETSPELFKQRRNSDGSVTIIVGGI